MMKQFKKALVLAPHTDDGELGCGGTIAKLKENGCEVFYTAFSSCEQSVPDHLPKDILVSELRNATTVLGIDADHLTLLDYQVRMFSYKRQEILEDLVVLKKRINPDIVFIPSVNDIHQDHSTIALEAVRAFKNTSILSYELPWNNMSFQNQCFVTLDETHIQKKINALQAYQSQSHRIYVSADFVKSLSLVRGVQAGCVNAEVFEVVRMMF